MRDRTSDRLVQEPRIKRIVRHRPRSEAEPDQRHRPRSEAEPDQRPRPRSEAEPDPGPRPAGTPSEDRAVPTPRGPARDERPEDRALR